MCYQVGKQYPYIHVDFTNTSKSLCVKYYRPWLDKLNAINIKLLTCKQHVKVPWEFDDHIKYDGFIFSEYPVNGQERLYYNQYPVAHFGQLDDANDWLCLCMQDEKYTRYQDLTRYLEIVISTTHRDGLAPQNQQLLKDHYQEIVNMVNDLDFTVEVKPFMIKDHNGKSFPYSDLSYVLIQPRS